MSVKDDSSRGPRTRGGIGSYGNYPWDANYDHDSFLSEMVPVSFDDCCDGNEKGYSSLTDEMLVRGITPFPMVQIGVGDLDHVMPSKAGVRG